MSHNDPAQPELHEKDEKQAASQHNSERGPAWQAPVDLIPEGTLDPVYQAKAHVLNEAIQEIGVFLGHFICHLCGSQGVPRDG